MPKLSVLSLLLTLGSSLIFPKQTLAHLVNLTDGELGLNTRLSVVASNEYVRRKCEEFTMGMDVVVGSEKLYCSRLLPEFYQHRQFELAWSKLEKKELIEILSSAGEEGLNPNDYHLEALINFNPDPQNPVEMGEMDLLLTDAFLLYASHFLNGKVNPETVEGEWKAIRREGNAREFLERSQATSEIKTNLRSLEPGFKSYTSLKQALKEYTAIKNGGGWKPIPDGETLKPSMVDNIRVPLIIARLEATKDLEKKPTDASTYSETVSEAVKKYQLRNGLDPDGNLGKMTTASMNVPVEDRISQIKVNLERFRWISQELGNHYIMVNIADYRMEVYRNNELTYHDKVIVGKPYRKTPVFSSKMTYMVVNPTWTVPPTILFNDILPEVKKNPGYLSTKNIRVLQGQGSSVQVIDPYSIDWAGLSKNYFPYVLRQDSGPTNALGAVKFMFPNQYNVYIHDTPSRELFARPDRAFSSGCIRLNNPLQFAQYLLADDPNWTEAQLKQAVGSGTERSIILATPVNVHILYLTAWSENGLVHFRNDLYERNQAVLTALNSLPPLL